VTDIPLSVEDAAAALLSGVVSCAELTQRASSSKVHPWHSLSVREERRIRTDHASTATDSPGSRS
jgi:hypothetical protein